MDPHTSANQVLAQIAAFTSDSKKQ